MESQVEGLILCLGRVTGLCLGGRYVWVST